MLLDRQRQPLIDTAGGRLVQRAPRMFEEQPHGSRRPVTGRHVLRPDGDVGFQADGYDHGQRLIIDPVLVYSGYLGGSGDDKAFAAASDGAGNTYVTGTTTSNDFPTTTGAYQTSGAATAFVARLNASGSALVYSTYLAGATPAGLAVDLAGNAYVTGNVASASFPVVNAYQSSGPAPAAFVTKVNVSGDALLYSTYLGRYTVTGQAIAVDAYGQAYVTGGVSPYPFGSFYPITATGGAFQASGGGGSDAYVAKFTADGSALAYLSFLGGSGNDDGRGLAVGADGSAYVTGATASTNFPTTGGASQTTSGGGANDAFVTKVAPDGSAKTYSTYLGGSGDDQGNAIAVNRAGNAYVAGRTTGSFPTAGGAYQTAFGGGATDAFVTELNTAGTGLAWSTYLGGTGADIAYGVGVDLSGYPVVVGSTTGSFPTSVGAMQTSYGGGATDGFVTRLLTDGTGLAYSSYLGGSGADEARGVALDPLANAAVAGLTNSSNFPTVGAVQGALAGAGTYDAFVAKVSPKPLPPVFTSITTDTGSSATDQITTDATLSLAGTGTANGTLTLYRAGVGLVGTASIDNSGNWTYDYTATTLPEGTQAFWGTVTSAAATGEPSPAFLVAVDNTAPAVNLTVDASTTSFAPAVRVTASDLNGLPDGTQVRLDADLNNDGDFLDAGESSYATGTLAGGTALLVPPAFSGTGTYRLRARVTDLAGNEGTSAAATVTVTAVTSWSATGQVLTRDPVDGLDRLQLGNLQLAHALDLDQSPGTGQGGSPALVYNSESVSVKPVVQAVVQSANNAALPATVSATLTFNGTTGSAQNYGTTGLARGDGLVIAAQAGSAITTTGRYAWSLTVQVTGQPNIVLSGVTYVVAQDSSVFGAGWTFSATDRLYSIASDANGPAGMLRAYGTGGWRFYQGTSTFTSPAGDFGTLSLSGGVYTYTTPDGRTSTFNSGGYQTGWASADGQETRAYRYDGSNNLTGATAIDGALATFAYASGKVSTITGVNSRVTTLSYTGSDLTQVVNPDGGVRTFTYDGGHRATREQFGPSRENNWAYAAGGALATVTWGTGASPSVAALSPASAQGLSVAARGPAAASVTDPLGDKATWRLDAAGRPLQFAAADGGVMSWARAGNGRATAVTDPIGRTTSYAYDASGYQTLVTLPDGNTRSYAYQAGFHALTTMTDERNNTTTYAYDASGRQTATTDALGNRTTFTYLGSGLLQAVQDARGDRTTYAYDASRRLTATTNALGDATTLTYDAAGNVQTAKDPLGRVTTFAYDAVGRRTTRTDALGGVTTGTYDGAGLPLASVDPLGHETDAPYDSFKRGLSSGQQMAVGTGAQASTLRSYDAAGRQTGARDPNGWWTNTAYDAAGRTTRTTDALGSGRLAAYDLAGQATATRDELGHWTRRSYNARGWVTSVTDALGNVTTAAYDAAGNVTAVTDPLNHTTTYQYDALQRQTAAVDALGNRATVTYDAVGDVAMRTDQLGRVTSYAYDALNRHTTTTEAVGTALERTGTVAYDKVGNVTAATDALSHAVTYAYDTLDRRTTATDPLGNGTTATYDAAGNMVTLKDALGQVTTYAYDARDRAITVTDPLGHVWRVVPDAAGRGAGSVDAQGNVSRSGLDPLGRPQAVLDAVNGLTVRRFDAAGNLWSLTDPDGNETQFVYDGLNRETNRKDPLGKVVTTAYDAAGRVTSMTDRLGRQVTYAYDSADRRTGSTWKSSGGATVDLLTYTYDARGQMLTAADNAGTITSIYDELNRLKAQTNLFGQTLTYSYGDDALRLRRAGRVGRPRRQ